MAIVDRVQAGMTFVDGLGIGDVGGEVLRDRRKLAGDGVVVVVVTVDSQTGELVGGPDIVNRGFVYEEASQDILEEARDRVVATIGETADARVTDPLGPAARDPAHARPLLQRGHAAQAGDPAGRHGGVSLRRGDVMDAQGTMRLMFDTMDAYDRADFDRLAEIYDEHAPWVSVEPGEWDCKNREEIFARFREGMSAGVHVEFDEMRSTPTHVVLKTHVGDSGPLVTVFTFEGRRIVHVQDHETMEAAEVAISS